MPSEKYATRRGSVEDGRRMITACFARAPQRCTSRIYMHFLLMFQEVRPIRKTRNQLMLTGSGKIPANATESLRTFSRAKPAGHLLFDLHHPDIPLPQVVIKRHAKVRHERQHLTLEVTQTDQQVHWWRLFGTPAFFLRALGGGPGRR